jgi:hypothetical protein
MKLKTFFANFQILGPLGCQGWVVIPQIVKKSQNHCTLLGILDVVHVSGEQPGKPKVLQVTVAIIQHQYAVQVQNTSVMDDFS